MRVIGLDLSLRATGLAVIDTDTGAIDVQVIKTATAPFVSSDHDKVRWTITRLRRTAAPIRSAHARHLPTVTCIEGPSFGSKGGAADERAGLRWLTLDYLDACQSPFAIVPPTTLKAYATGKGNADKILMMQAAMKRLGDRCPDLPDDNACDALWLALAAAHRVGAPQVDLPAAQVARLDAVSWPELLSDDLEVTA